MVWYVQTNIYSVALKMAKVAAAVIVIVLPLAAHFLALYAPQKILVLVLSLFAMLLVPTLLFVLGRIQMASGMRYKLTKRYVSTPDWRYSWGWFSSYEIHHHPALAGVRSIDLIARTGNGYITLYFDPDEVDESQILQILGRMLPTTAPEEPAANV